MLKALYNMLLRVTDNFQLQSLILIKHFQQQVLKRRGSVITFKTSQGGKNVVGQDPLMVA